MAINGPQATATNAGVTGAIRAAARATGANFDYLLATARAESGLNPNASTKTSSARGLFQFVDRTWLATVKQAGPGLGYGRYADAITQDAPGPLTRSSGDTRWISPTSSRTRGLTSCSAAINASHTAGSRDTRSNRSIGG